MDRMKQQARMRIGKIDFTNVWPVFFHFPLERFGSQIEIVEQVPTQLNGEMAAGRIDLGPISSFAYGQSHEDYVLYPDLSVSAFGKVHSILLFCKKPLDAVANGKIALPTTSATSVNLLKIIMHKFYRGNPEYSYASPTLNDMIEKNDAALLIGDDAIRADWENDRYTVIDLGQEWEKWTGKWMSFAVWAVRRDTAERDPSMVDRVYRAFQDSKAIGLEHRDSMIEAARARVGGTKAYWLRYFSNLCSEFGQEQQEGLKLYYKYAGELGLLDRKVPLHIWTNTGVVQVEE